MIRSMCIVSSRIGNHWRARPEWFDALDAVCRGLPASGVLQTARQTTVDPFVMCLAKVHGFQVAKPFAGTSRLSPAQLTTGLMERADVVGLVCVRRAGHVARAIEKCDRQTPMIASSLVAPDLCQRWPGDVVHLASSLRKRQVIEPGRLDIAAPIEPFPSDDGKWLIHWTREQNRWPDQSEADYITSLVLGRAADGRPLFSLHRILEQQRLLASQQAIRGQHHVVCFSAAELKRLADGPVYRRHRMRWDFESYGLLIQRDYLQSIGARPVHYGTEAEWRSCLAAQQPWFQLKTAVGSAEEKEWRLAGNLDLNVIPTSAAKVYVKTLAEARWISQFSRFPVTVVPPP